MSIDVTISLALSVSGRGYNVNLILPERMTDETPFTFTVEQDGVNVPPSQVDTLLDVAIGDSTGPDANVHVAASPPRTLLEKATGNVVTGAGVSVQSGKPFRGGRFIDRSPRYGDLPPLDRQAAETERPVSANHRALSGGPRAPVQVERTPTGAQAPPEPV